MSHFFPSNLKSLRKSKGLSQEAFAAKIGINRPKVGSYEEGRAEPNLETLQNISHFFKLSIDDLLEKDLQHKKAKQSKNFDGNDLRVLPIIVNADQKERISLVPVKAAAGYLNGYADPEFIEELPHFNFPVPEFSQGTYRAFQLAGDSMLPVKPGSYVLAEYLENWNWIQDQDCYVVVSKEEGVVYKRVVNQFQENHSLALHSDNPSYESYTIEGKDLLEIWKAKAILSFDLPEKSTEPVSVDSLSSMIMQLQAEVNKLKAES